MICPECNWGFMLIHETASNKEWRKCTICAYCQIVDESHTAQTYYKECPE